MADDVSVTKRELAKPGFWQITIEFPTERGKERNRKRINFRGSAKAAEDKVKELRRQHSDAQMGYSPSTQTLREAIEATLVQKLATGKHSELTNISKLELARYHIFPHPIADRLLTRLQPDDIERFMQHLATVKSKTNGQPLKPAYRNNLLTLIAITTAAAYRKKTIMHDPAKLVERARVPSKRDTPKRAIETPTLARILATVPRQRQRRIFEILFRTGLRRGEFCGLTCGDVDLDPASGPPMLHVRRNIQRRDGQPVVLPTKTTAGVRSIPLSSDLVAIMRDVLRENRSKALALGVRMADLPLFQGKDGSWMAPWSLTSYFRVICDRAGIEHARLHDLRHTYVTQALRHTKNVAMISKFAGHADEAVTLGVYQHAMAEDLHTVTDPFAGVDMTGDPAAIARLPKRNVS